MTNVNTLLCIDRPEHFDLDEIFDCGQAFRFEKVNGAWCGVAFGRAMRFSQDERGIYINTDREEYERIWKHYLSLDKDYTAIREDIKAHFPTGVIEEAMKVGDGIRILNQQPWETLCSFIISQNNNIPRIKSLIESISRECGDKIEGGYAFPTPSQLLSLGENGLKRLKTGFRAAYLIDAARTVSDGLDLELIRDEDSYETGLEKLCKIKGVGPKVASCTLLFSMEKLQSFPVDVWIKRVIDKYYNGSLDVTALGSYAGLAQQYLFYYERKKK